ncbi:hypothetical protein [Algiphilus sp.]|uniref:hypothetical protein n=1 Tax=Algiphilus sp. TaxID=1872431 RepID=UPI003B529861
MRDSPSASPRARRALRQRLQAAEARILDKPASSQPAVRVTRILPLMLIATIALWSFAPVSWLRVLTPWVGAFALLCAGVYLSAVVLRIGRFYWRHLSDLDQPSSSVHSVRRAVYQTVGVLLATLLLAVAFFVLSAQLLADTEGARESRLLWALTVGGMVLSLFFGELVTRLIEAMDALLSDAGDGTDQHHP